MATMIPLPTNAGPLIRRTALIDATRIEAIQQIISTLWSPFDCPAEFLPHLTWALSVDVWDNTWNETRKRQVIAAAPTIHRLKGTDYAVKAALEAFNLAYENIEWWESEPIGQRDTFSIDVLHFEIAGYLDGDLREQIKLSVKSAKPKSRSFAISHTLVEQGPAYVGALAESDVAFDSTYDDLLLAKIVTDGANAPTITALVNVRDYRLFVKKTTYELTTALVERGPDTAPIYTLNLARKPGFSLETYKTGPATAHLIDVVTNVFFDADRYTARPQIVGIYTDQAQADKGTIDGVYSGWIQM